MVTLADVQRIAIAIRYAALTLAAAKPDKTRTPKGVERNVYLRHSFDAIAASPSAPPHPAER